MKSSAAAPDAELLQRMVEIDQRVAKVADLTADFEQRKFTALLRKPLVSSGFVRVKGSAMRWDTAKPTPSVMYIDERSAQIYYPQQNVLEIYKLDQRLGELAASPLPRLEPLKKHFTFEQIPTKDMVEPKDAAKYPEPDCLTLRLTPINSKLREHVEQVRVLMDVRAAHIVRVEMTDTDGDRTVILFSGVKTNTGLADLAITVPRGTKVTRPLESLEGNSDGDGRK